MKCNHCGQDMDPGRCGYEPAMCPNVKFFIDVWGHTDLLTGNTYEADAKPVHCTDSHVQHIALVDQYIEAELNPKH